MMKVKLGRFISLLAVAIFATATTIQAQTVERVMSLNELFELADSVSLTIKRAESSAKVADAAVGIVTIIGLCFSDMRGKFKGVIPKLPSLWRMVKYDK